MKIVYHIFLILTMFMPVISSAGPLETLDIQSCHYLCGTSEFTAIIPENRIRNTVLITTEYTGKGVKTFIQKTLNAAYQQLHILDISRYRTSSEFKDVFQRMPSEHTTYIIFDSAFTEENLPLLPLPLIETMHSFAILKQDRSVSMQNDDRVEKKTTPPLYLFSLCLWNREATLSLSTQEKEKEIEKIINALNYILSSLIQKGEPDLQIHRDQNACDFTPSTQPTLYQRSAPPPVHLMQPPGPSLPYLMQPPWLSPPYLIRPPEPLVPSFLQPSYMLPFSASIPPYVTLPQFTGPHASVSPYAIPVPLQFTAPPLTPFYATSPMRPPLLPLPPPPPQPSKNLRSYLKNTARHLNAKHVPCSAERKILDRTQCPFLQQVHKIGSFEIPMCDSKKIWYQCTKQCEYITFENCVHNSFFFLSNFFSCKIPFSVDDKKISWVNVAAFIFAKKLDYFEPPLPEEMKQNIFSELQQCDQDNSSHTFTSLEIFKQFTAEIKEKYFFNKANWKKIATTLLFHALYSKFDNNPDLKEQLLQTEPKIILYRNETQCSKKTPPYFSEQYFWGVHLTRNRGCNVLGNFLCLVRKYLRNGETPPPFHDA